VLRDLGDTLIHIGNPQKARELWQKALGICEALQIPEGDEIRKRLTVLTAEVSEPASDS